MPAEAGDANKTPTPLPLRNVSPARSSRGGGNNRMKDRVAAIRAERKGTATPSPRPSPTPSDEPERKDAAEPHLKSTTALDKVGCRARQAPQF